MIDRLFDFKRRDGYNPNRYWNCTLKCNIGYFKAGDTFQLIELNHKKSTITFSSYVDENLQSKDYIFNLHYSIGACLSDT